MEYLLQWVYRPVSSSDAESDVSLEAHNVQPPEILANFFLPSQQQAARQDLPASFFGAAVLGGRQRFLFSSEQSQFLFRSEQSDSKCVISGHAAGVRFILANFVTWLLEHLQASRRDLTREKGEKLDANGLSSLPFWSWWLRSSGASRHAAISPTAQFLFSNLCFSFPVGDRSGTWLAFSKMKREWGKGFFILAGLGEKVLIHSQWGRRQN